LKLVADPSGNGLCSVIVVWSKFWVSTRISYTKCIQ